MLHFDLALVAFKEERPLDDILGNLVVPLITIVDAIDGFISSSQVSFLHRLTAIIIQSC